MTKRAKKKHHKRHETIYRAAGFGYLGYLNTQQFGTAQTPTGDMTTTPSGGDAGASPSSP